MAIARRGTPTTLAQTSSATSGVMTVPTGVADGDGLVLVVWMLGSNTLTVTSGLTGWTLKKTVTASTVVSGHIFTRVASSEPASYTMGYASCRVIAAMAAYSGTDQTDFVVAVDGQSGGTTVHTTPSVSSVNVDDWAFACFADRITSSASKNTGWTPGAGISTLLASLLSNNAAGTSPWGSMDVCDSNGAVSVGAHSYTDTSTTNTGNAMAGLVIIKAAVTGGGTVNGTATLAGSGSLTATPTVLVPGTASLSGTGTLSAAPTVLVPGAAALAGAGTMSATGQVIVPGTATLAGVGTMTATSGSPPVSGAATMSGVGALTAAGTVLVPGRATLAGAGSLATAGTVVVPGAATLAGVGTVTAVGRVLVPATATLVGTGSLTATGQVIVPGSAVMVGTGTLAAAATSHQHPGSMTPGSTSAGQSTSTASGLHLGSAAAGTLTPTSRTATLTTGG